jgi:uncharacterized membrane protein HdeD (DUF308 family)
VPALLKLADLVADERDMLRRNWGWFVALGALFVLLGLFGLVFVGLATLVAVVLLGWCFLLAGVAEIVHAIARKGWSGFWLDLISGLITGLIGLFILLRPAEGASVLTVVLGVVFVIGGIFRLGAAVAVKSPYTGWFVLHGVITLLLGGMILSDWPVSSAWVIGTLVSIDLLFNGARLISFGTALKNLPAIGDDAERAPTAPPA